jgi:hypothetical protein
MIRTVHAIDAKQNEDGAYVITDAKWPRGDAFTQDREWLYHRMRAEFEQRMSNAVLSPYVTLDTRP